MIEKWLEYTENYTSPRIFRLWAVITAIGMAGKRSIWTEVGDNTIYPNLFVFLVGPAGTGKTQAMKPVMAVLQRSKAVKLLPSDASKASLLDSLKTFQVGVNRKLPNGSWDLEQTHYGALLVTELSAFMSDYDKSIAGLLTDLFDCNELYKEEKRSSNSVGEIVNPGIGVLIGTATTNLGATIHGDLWGSGFTARIIMIFSADKVRPANMWAKRTDNSALKLEIEKDFTKLGEKTGAMEWTEGAKDLLWSFRCDSEDETPIHNKLIDYMTRRWFHLTKLCMISALSYGRMTVEAEDFEQAHGWLTKAEAAMPEIFKGMVNHADGEIFEELKTAMHAAFAKDHQPLSNTQLVQFFTSRTAAYNVENMIKVAEKADYIRRMAGTDGDEAQWLPGSRTARWV